MISQWQRPIARRQQGAWYVYLSSLDVYCSTVQGLLDWFEVDLGFTELSFIQIDLVCVSVFNTAAQ